MSLLAVNHHYYENKNSRRGIWPTTQKDLKAEIAALKKTRRPVTQENLLAAFNDLGGRSLQDTFLLTFDDGLKEQMAAFHDLHKFGLGGIFFVPTEPLVKKKVLDVHKVHLLRTKRGDQELLADIKKAFPSYSDYLDESAARAQYPYDNHEARTVKSLLNYALNPVEKKIWLDRMFKSIFGREQEVVKNLYMNREDLQILGKNGMLGSHAHSHRPLGQLNPSEIDFEIEHSREILQELSGVPIVGISFPYGVSGAVSEAVYQACVQSDISFGFTMQRGTNTVEDLKSPIRLKRIDCKDLPDFI